MLRKKIIIAIDGFASSGKSTLAKDLAKALGYVFIDTGAMYRGISYFAKHHGFISSGEVNRQALIESLNSIELHFGTINAKNELPLFLNGIEITNEIRTNEISAIVSMVALIPEVRAKLVQMQREMGKNGGIVMDGRDIGTVVFPNADLKLFVTADLAVRAKRRFQEMQHINPMVDLQQVMNNLADRDRIDTTRAHSPLLQAADAILFDTGLMTRESQLKKALELAQKVINA